MSHNIKGGQFILLRIEQNGPKVWSVVVDDDVEPIKLFLSPSSVTNKYFIVTKFIERVAEHNVEGFSNWFINFLTDCHDENLRSKAVVDSIPQIKNYVDSYMDSLTFDYSQFVDMTKVKKNSILFKPDEIEQIIRLSSYLKIYSVISNNEKLKLGAQLHREVYNQFASDIVETDIIRKIYDVIKTKTFRYNLTDRFMWEYIKNVQGKDIGVHVIEIFNFIMNNILILCEIDKNPITYFVGVIDESVKWFLRSVYKGSIVYDDSISTEDIQGINTDNLKTYSYNDTLGRLKSIAYEKIYELLQRQSTMSTEKVDDDEFIISFHERASEINFISPLAETLVFPILSQMTHIPFHHFRTLSPEHTAVIAVYIQVLFRRVFGTDYKDLFTLLNFYPMKSPSMSTTYKIKAVHEYLKTQQETQNFFGFTTKILPHTLLCHFIGRVSRVDFCDILTGKRLGGIPLSKIENGMIKFFTAYFSGGMKKEIDEMTKLMNADF
ncbi:MAG: hypothetical protein DRN27_09200 [Thermoplasmata archaeon]|nr:MAG: hypothetical protein DRN27_09200 [Thermoplasmata archaeon]